MFKKYKVNELSWTLLVNLVLIVLTALYSIVGWVALIAIVLEGYLFLQLSNKLKGIPILDKKMKSSMYFVILVILMFIGAILNKDIKGALLAGLILNVTIASLSLASRIPDFIVLRERERGTIKTDTTSDLIKADFVIKKAIKEAKNRDLLWLARSLEDLQDKASPLNLTNVDSLPDFTPLINVEKRLNDDSPISESQELYLRGVVNRIKNQLNDKKKRARCDFKTNQD